MIGGVWSWVRVKSASTAKADCEFALSRWTEVQLPLLKQGAPT